VRPTLLGASLRSDDQYRSSQWQPLRDKSNSPNPQHNRAKGMEGATGIEGGAAETRARSSGTDLTDVALGHGRRRGGGPSGVGVRQERHPLVLPGEFVGGVHLLVAGDAERGLVRAAQHPRLRGPARVALDLHPLAPR
jgi:hypothetical protein